MSQPPRVIYLFDSPRTCSHLLHKLFSAHPQLVQTKFPFATSAFYGPVRLGLIEQQQQQQQQQHGVVRRGTELPEPPADEDEDELYEASSAALLSFIENARAEGKTAWVKEHVLLHLKPRELFNEMRDRGRSRAEVREKENPTVVPDEVMFGEDTAAVLLVRHPGLVIPSYLRAQRGFFGLEAGDEVFAAYTTNRFTRMIYHVYSERAGREVTVLDAKDVVHDTERLMGKVCAKLGLREDGVVYRWEKMKKEEAERRDGKFATFFYGEILNSEGVKRGEGRAKEDDFNLDVEQEKWTEEFGREAAYKLRELVDDEMADYKFLSERRLRP